ncbi:MAG: hypothetical protein HY048_16660 [Acidobacteria bacterium]|nr:hypothetical protein [Acidobacteriota bacterium]
MHPDLERLISEDETARAGVDAASSAARARLEAVRADVACQREARLRQLDQALERSVTQILDEADREAGRRRARREAHSREAAARGAALVDRAADLWVRIVREGPAPKGSIP